MIPSMVELSTMLSRLMPSWTSTEFVRVNMMALGLSPTLHVTLCKLVRWTGRRILCQGHACKCETMMLTMRRCDGVSQQ
jgi:hypothetical protein